MGDVTLNSRPFRPLPPPGTALALPPGTGVCSGVRAVQPVVTRPRVKSWSATIALCVLLGSPMAMPRYRAAAGVTQTPIKHVVVVIGENRSFDHVFGTYVPMSGQTISTLLSKGIATASGGPGPNFALAQQFTVAPQASYYIAALGKTPYLALPPPDTGRTPTAPSDASPPFKTLAEAAAAEPDLA